MSTNVVNLDALIPREDFTIEVDQPASGGALDKISITHLEGPYFGPDLRKPDFQRETVQWTPAKVVDLLRAFVDSDLIPAVILWRQGRYLFVVDGAHRLSALLAWIYDDYGDRTKSLEYFGGHITSEQRRVAERTRTLVNKEIGPYAVYRAARTSPSGAAPQLQKRLSNLAVNNIIAQWVPAADATSAEASFFKINQAATPIDATEKRILKARHSASAIAARAITHGGTGHKYWSAFDKDPRLAIEQSGAAIFKALYDPPISGMPVTTLDVPVAGRGYNTLPFIFDLVNDANNIAVADTTAKKAVKETLPKDADGATTLAYLRAVAKRIERITGDSPMSLGLHPVVYFYSRSGAFQPLAFLAASQFVEQLVKGNRLAEFSRARSAFEDFLADHKEAVSLLVHRFGTGSRSLPWIVKYYEVVLKGFLKGLTGDQVQQELADTDFSFLTVPRPTSAHRYSSSTKHPFNSGTKTATYFASALPGCVRCALCGARVHKNSMHFDHKQLVRDGGSADMRNAQVTHPYCDSSKG